MKKVLLKPAVWLLPMMVAAMPLIFTACDDEDTKTAPTVTTGTPTNVTPSMAIVPGDITSNGGEIITAAGICYSVTNATPTVGDDTTKTTVLTGAFTSRLKDLTSGTIYRVRAYATNRVGTSYGAVMTFTTGNEAPTVMNVVINGEIKGDIDVDVTYDYDDKENDAESGTTIQWYRADDATGAGKIPIENATTDKYRINEDDQGKFIWVGVIPKSSSGTLVGTEVTSDKKGPVGAATTVTFIYNGDEVTYGIINSSTTGRRWLDRNLGAPNAPMSYNDYANYGDLFQWGRTADGHQLINRAASQAETTGVNGVTDILSSTDSPVDKKFITTSSNPYDWRSTPNNMLWQGVDGINNPCPKGWRIPSRNEWEAETLGVSASDSFEKLNLTVTGTRSSSGNFSGIGSDDAYYWTSTTVVNSTGDKSVAYIIFGGNYVLKNNNGRGTGLACKCIKEESE
jgi:uncharacterized protein (TIGR02145 family)